MKIWFYLMLDREIILYHFGLNACNVRSVSMYTMM